MNTQNPIISVSVIDYIGQVDDGVALLLNVMIFDNAYEMSYWFNKEGTVRLVPEQKFLDKLNITSIYDYEGFKDLIYIIHSNIPNVEKILDEFIK